MFEKTLSDLVKGIRSNKRREAEFVSKCIAEIKDELSSKDKSHSIKATAVLKLAYLQMLGYDMQWASFYIVEVMSSPGFAQKRLGYLGASVSFNDETEVVLLCTNMFKKDFQSPNPYEVGVAINCLANICTVDLARDLVADVVSLMNSNRAYVRKKAVLVMYKIFLKFPDALRPSFPKLKEKLEDRDSSAISCAVNVICELARKNPSNYLSLAPLFFKLLTVTSNNWMLIKIVKLLGALCPLEPRLGKKLVEPLTNLINTTPAKSLLYEAIHTVSVGMTPHLSIVQLSMEKLKGFVEDEDQNLKYLGLLAMGNFMKVHPRVVAEHKSMILKCLNDEDITIRHRALDLVSGMVSKKNLMDICRILMEHVSTSEGSFRHDLVEKIIEVSSKENYACMTNFEWYIATLCKLARMPGVCNGHHLRQQLMDVIIRVRAVRPYGVKMMVELLRDAEMFSQSSRDPTAAEVLYAAAWLVGEFSHFLEVGQHHPVLTALLSARVTSLPEHVQSVYLQNALKVYVSASRTSGFNAAPPGLGLSIGDATPPAGAPPSEGDLLSLADTTPAPSIAPPASDLLSTAPPSSAGGDDLDMLLGADNLPPKPAEDASANTPAADGAGAGAGAGAGVVLLGGNAPAELQELHGLLTERLPEFEVSTLLEVQERARVCNQLLLLAVDASSLEQLAALFVDELNPVAPKAQGKVPVPEGLDLDARIHEEEEEPEDEDEEEEEEGWGSEEETREAKKAARKKKKQEDAEWEGSDKFAVKPSKKEMKKIHKDAEKERKKRTQDPFYLGAKKEDDSPQLLEEDEVKDIPIFQLSDNEDDGKKKKKKKKKKADSDDDDDDAGSAPPESPAGQPSFTVDMGYEMPEGGDDDDEEDQAQTTDELSSRLNVDLSKPLKKNEVLPTISAYERKSRYEVEEEMRKQKKEKKKDKDKDKKKSKSKTKDDEDEEEADEEEGKKKRDKKKDKEAKAAAPDIGDLLDVGSGPVPPASAETPATPTDAAPAPATDDLDELFGGGAPAKQKEDEDEEGGKPAKEEKKSKKDKKDKEEKKSKKDKKAKRVEDSDEEDEDEEEERQKKSKKDKKDKKSSKSDKKDSKKDKKEREGPPPTLKPRTLTGDSLLKATYAAKASMMSDAKVPPVSVVVTVTNVGSYALQPVSLHVTSSMVVRATLPPQDLPSLAPGASADMRMELTVSSVSKPHKVKVQLKYEAVGEGAPAAPVSLQTELLLPCSSFLQPKEMAVEEFNSLIANNAVPHQSSAVIEGAEGRSFKQTLQLLSMLLNLKMIHGLDNAASLYAITVQGHHVAVLAKGKSGNMVSVDMRSSDEALCQQLCNEVSGLPLFIA